jgi:N-methylhydantoinase A
MEVRGNKPEGPYRIAIDTGGTFTDAVVMDAAGNIVVTKAATTPEDNTIGVLNSIDKAATRLGLSSRELLVKTDMIIHASTTASNTLVMQTGAKTGSICTKGFRDVVEMRRGWRGDPFDIKAPLPTQLSPRYLRAVVDERILYDGTIQTPLNDQDVERACELFKKHGVGSIAVCLLFSFTNPTHERRVAEICQRILPEVHVSLSSDVLPMMDEFDRFSTTTVDAYVAPNTRTYILSLIDKLQSLGFQGRLFIGACSGGVMRPEDAAKKSVYTVESGPAAVPVAGAYYGQTKDWPNIIAIDMGGTTFKAALVPEGRVETSYDMWFENQRLAMQMVNVHSVGAGGGSIAWLDSSGAVRVGPKSAGADPGPACYGKGGQNPTVTDADVALGYIPDDYFLGGELSLYKDLAIKAIKEKIADPLGKDVYEAAYAIYGIVTAEMADAVEEISVKRGVDPRDFDMIVGGGAAAVHAAFISDAIEVRRTYIPRTAAILGAFGWLCSDLRYDFVRSKVMYASEADLELLNRIFDEMEAEARQVLEREGELEMLRFIDARYAGQFHDVQIEVASGRLTAESIAKMKEQFSDKHRAIYTFAMPERDVVFTNYRLVARKGLPRPILTSQQDNGSSPSGALKRSRKCFFHEAGGFVETSVYDGPSLLAGNVVKGPAIIEEPTTTVLIPPHFKCSVDGYGNYVLEKE